MPTEDVPEWGEAQLQEAIQERFGGLADAMREEISEWFEAGDNLVVCQSESGRYQFARLASSQALASVTLPEGYSLVTLIKSNPIGRIE
jgi:hypothetical protein